MAVVNQRWPGTVARRETSMKYIDDETFDARRRAIQQDVSNTLDRVVDDYSHHWQGVIGEPLQNSFDGWCANRFERGTIPEDQELCVRLGVDVDSRVFTVQDNAGGMPESTFYDDFPGLDTPGEEKQSGNAGGSYGRGFHVVAQLGDEAYAETLHDGFNGGIVVRGANQATVDPHVGIETEGTMIEVRDANVDVILDLADWDQITSYIQQRFHGMLKRDDVTVEYVVDSEVREIQPVDLEDFDVLYEGEMEFSFGASEHTLPNVIIYDATSSDEPVPFSGISLLKRNAHLDEPFMRVHEYKPRQVRHIDKMFGFADATTLCPKYENNAHNRLNSNAVSATPLKDKLEALEQEHFIGTPTDLDEKGDIVDATLEVVNRCWEDNPFDPEHLTNTEDGMAGTLGLDGEDDGGPGGEREDPDAGADDDTVVNSEDDGEETRQQLGGDPDNDPTDIEDVDVDLDIDSSSDDDEPTLSCSSRTGRVDIDEGYTIWATVENPSGSGYESFEVSARLETPEYSDLEQELASMAFDVQPGEATNGEDSWEVFPDVAGEYTLRATLTDAETDETLNTGSVTFRASDPTEDDEPVTDADEGASPTVSFLEEIKFVPAGDEDDFRAELNEGAVGMVLLANSAHPEWKHAVKQDGSSGTYNQKLTLIRWANEAIVNRMLLDELEDQLDKMATDDGTPLSEELSTFVRDQLIEHVSELVAAGHREVSA